MRRITVCAHGTLEGMRVSNVPETKLSPSEVLVEISASSLNYHDYLVVSGILPTAPDRIPMSDGVGKIVEVGQEVSEFSVGDRVMATFFPDWIDGKPSASKIARMRGDQIDGFAVEFASLSPQSLTKVPSNLSDVQAATLACAGLTAWRALIVEGNVHPGEYVLVQGGGGVSIFAVQLAKMVGPR